MPTHIPACTVSETGGFRYIARLAPVASPRGTLSFTLSTTWRDAKDPDAERRVLQLDLDADALDRLRALLDEGASLVDASSAADALVTAGRDEARHG